MFADEDNLDCPLEEMLASSDVPGDAAEMGTYFSQNHILDGLIEFMLYPFTEEEEEKSRKEFIAADSIEDLPTWLKYPYKATEVLARDVDEVMTKLHDTPELLEKLFNFLDLDVINPWLALKLTECVHKLYIKSPPQMMDFLRELQKRKPVVNRLVYHIASPPLCDLLGSFLGALNEDDLRVPPNIHLWWLQNNLITDILDMIVNGGIDHSISGCRFLVDLVRRFSFPNRKLLPYIQAIATKESLIKLITSMLKSERDDGNSVLFQEGAALLVTLINLEKTPPMTLCKIQPAQEEADIQDTVLNVCLSFLDGFKTVLEDPGKLPPMKVTWQAEELNVPLGPCRVKVMEMVSHLARTRPSVTHEHIAKSSILKPMLQIFKTYEMHNIAHCCLTEVVEGSISVLDADDSASYGLLNHLIHECKLPEFILSCNDANSEQIKERNYSKGYMGQLNLMSEYIHKPPLCKIPKEGLAMPLLEHVRGWSEYIVVLETRLEIERVSPWPVVPEEEGLTFDSLGKIAFGQGGNQVESASTNNFINTEPDRHTNTYAESSNTAEEESEGASTEDKYKISNSKLSRYHNSVANESEAAGTDASGVEGLFSQDLGHDIQSSEPKEEEEKQVLNDFTNNNWDKAITNIIQTGASSGAQFMDTVEELLPEKEHDSEPSASPLTTDASHVQYTDLAASPTPAMHPHLVHKIEEEHEARYNTFQFWNLPADVDLDVELGEG